MRRAVAVAIAIAAPLLGVVAVPADATTAAVRLPAPFSLFQSSCSGGTPEASLQRVTGPGTPPAGTGSLRIDSGASTVAGLQYDVGLPVADLQAWRFAHYETGTGGTLIAQIAVDRDGTGAHSDLLDYTVSRSGSTWQTLDVLAQTLVYSPAEGGGSLTSWSDFVSHNPDAVVTNVLWAMLDCGPVQVTNVDKWVIRLHGTTHTYDFEAAPTLTPSVSQSTITATAPVTLRVTLKGDGVPMPRQPVELWAKSYPSTTYRLVARATTNSSGVATSVQRPEVQTVYRWQADVSGFNRGVSATRTVKTRTRLTINVLDPTLRSGQRLVVWGATRTTRSGDTVTLLRRTSSGLRTLASTRTRSDGTYAFDRTLSRGSYRLLTRIGAGDGDLAATSTDVKVSAA